MSLKSHAQGSPFPPTKPGVLRIYSMRFCPFAQRTRLVLAHKNIPCEVVNVDLVKKPDWFLALNPLGQVPVLQIDDKIIPESTATCDWLDDVYPENRLQPVDPYLKVWDRVLHEYISKLIGPLYGAMRATDASEIEMKAAEIKKHLQFYEEKLKGRGDGPFFGGSKPSGFDFLMWPFYERLPALTILKDNPVLEIEADKIPTLTAWDKAMRQLPAVKNTMFNALSHVNWYKSVGKGTPDYDMYLAEH
ncbi:hypothetical protein EGW08_000207 [Elysia chlorotica]|uniref:Glutathione S-transferase omega n=1 Tax=Elysia chlorotica TaxID=188477 RepID=A0A3S1AH53_ELYCH|nr:hypothetical protein EGW08_000207 [Elysia chlorotica]